MVILDPQFQKFETEFKRIMNECVNVPSYRGGYWAILQANQLVSSLAKFGISLEGRRVIDLGCGATRPVSTSILMYLLGAQTCLALDLERPNDFPAIALAEYANLVAICSGLASLELSAAGQSMTDVRRKMAEFDLAALLNGDLHSGLPEGIRHVIGRYQDLSPTERRFDLMISMSVWEHIADMSDVAKCAREAIDRNGFVFTAIDFRDHRVYSSNASPWQYLVDDEDYMPGYINKIRYTEMRSLINSAGFDIVDATLVQEEPPPDIIKSILPKYAAMSDLDLKTTEARLLLRPI